MVTFIAVVIDDRVEDRPATPSRRRVAVGQLYRGRAVITAAAELIDDGRAPETLRSL